MKRAFVSCMVLAVVLETAASTTAAPNESTEQSSNPSVDRRGNPPEDNTPAPATTIFWIDSGVGYRRVGLTTLRVECNIGGDALTGDLVPAVLDGPALDLGIGFRWLVLTLGARMTAAFFNDSSPDRTDASSQFYSLDAELGLRVPAGRLEPFVVLGGGYSVFGGLDDAISGVGQGLNIDGGNLRLALGFDYFVSKNWSVGARATGEVLFLARPGIPIRSLANAQSVSTLGEAKARLLEGEGSSAGTAFAVSIGPGLHF